MKKKSTNEPVYCIVKYFHYNATRKPLKCKDCVMKCKYNKNNGGDKDDQSAD